jgi:hypothetical protein
MKIGEILKIEKKCFTTTIDLNQNIDVNLGRIKATQTIYPTGQKMAWI